MVKRMSYHSLYLNNEFFRSIYSQYCTNLCMLLMKLWEQMLTKSLEGLSIELATDFQRVLRVKTYTSQAAAFKQLKSELPVFPKSYGGNAFPHICSAFTRPGMIQFTLPTYLVYHISFLEHHLSCIIKHFPSSVLLAYFLNYILLLAWKQLCLSNVNKKNFRCRYWW